MTTEAPARIQAPSACSVSDRNRRPAAGCFVVGQAFQPDVSGDVRLESLTYEFSDHRLDIGPARVL